MRSFKSAIVGSLLLLTLAVAQCPAKETKVREWSSASGNFKTKARLVDYSDTEVRLKNPEGKVLTVPIEKLSQSDREHLTTAVENVYRVPGVLRIPNPLAGVGWRIHTDAEENGVRLLVLQTNGEPGEPTVTLTVQPIGELSEPQQVEAYKLYATQAIENFGNLGLAVSDIQQPELAQKIKDDDVFAAKLAIPDAGQLSLRAFSRFSGEQAFHFLALAPEEKTAEKLIKCHKSLTTDEDGRSE